MEQPLQPRLQPNNYDHYDDHNYNNYDNYDYNHDNHNNHYNHDYNATTMNGFPIGFGLQLIPGSRYDHETCACAALAPAAMMLLRVIPHAKIDLPDNLQLWVRRGWQLVLYHGIAVGGHL